MYYMIRTMHMRSKLDPHKNQHQVCSNSIHPIKLANRFAWCGVHQVYIWTVSFMCSPTHHTHNIHRVALLIFLLNTLAGKQAPNKFSNEIVFMHAILSHKLSASTIDGGSHRIKKTKKNRVASARHFKFWLADRRQEIRVLRMCYWIASYSSAKAYFKNHRYIYPPQWLSHPGRILTISTPFLFYFFILVFSIAILPSFGGQQK